MVFDKSKLEKSVIKNFKGGKKDFTANIYEDAENKILLGKLEPGASIGLHKHETDSEIIYIIKGDGTVCYDGENIPVCASQFHYCPKGHSHSLINTGNEFLEFFAVVTK